VESGHSFAVQVNEDCVSKLRVIGSFLRFPMLRTQEAMANSIDAGLEITN
jgi:hypothetical protein